LYTCIDEFGYDPHKRPVQKGHGNGCCQLTAPQIAKQIALFLDRLFILKY
jgi:hypothetical protein